MMRSRVTSSDIPPTTKQERERAFHNAAFSDNRRSRIVPAYATIRDSRAFYEEAIRSRAAGARLLEYGCGATALASTVGRDAAEVVGIDISDVAVQQATDRARQSGLRASYYAMDAEALDFPAGSFDVICSTAILHHLDLTKAYAEIARVLRPGGRAVFMEPLGHNPLINLYRRLTPRLRTPDEHPLRVADLERARRYFADVEVRYFGLCSLMAMPLVGRRGFGRALRALEAVDRTLFKRVPAVRRYAWQVVVVLSSPRTAAQPQTDDQG